MECSICFEEINENESVTPCRHVFHAACLNLWLEQSASCPLCRRQCRPEAQGQDQEVEDQDPDDEEVDEGFEDDVFLYLASEMLPLFYFFKAIAIGRFPNASHRHRIPRMFEHFMEILPAEEFQLVIEDDIGRTREDIINSYLDEEFENPVRQRSYVYESVYEPTMETMIGVFESFIRHPINGGYASENYERFDAFLDRLSSDEEYLLFRTRQTDLVIQINYN